MPSPYIFLNGVLILAAQAVCFYLLWIGLCAALGVTDAQDTEWFIQRWFI